LFVFFSFCHPSSVNGEQGLPAEQQPEMRVENGNAANVIQCMITRMRQWAT
jgi:hypothetical protein